MMTMTVVDLRAEAAAEARRLAQARAVFRDGDDRALARLECDAAWIAMPRRGRLKRAFGRRVCLVWRVAFEDASGRLVESRLVPIFVEISESARRALSDPAIPRRAWVRSLLHRADGPVRARVEAECDGWARQVRRVTGAFVSARSGRERDINGRRSTFRTASQPGLFDRRGERQHQARASAAAEAEQAALEGAQTIEAGGAIVRVPAGLLLVLVP